MPPGSSQPNRAVLLLRLTSSRQWDRTLDVAKEWLAEDPENTSAHLYAAQALVNLNRKADAFIHLTRVLAKNPDNAFAHRLMSMAQFGRKNYVEADKSIHRAIELRPRDSRNWYHLAWMCYRQKDLKNGLKWATKARELDPRNADILNLCALCDRDSGRSAGSLEEALALNPENPYAQNNLGIYYLNQGNDHAKAEACFRRALTLQPTLKVARRNLFLAVKRRDWIYRVLCAPRDMLFDLRNTLLRGKKGNVVALIFGVIVWILLARIFIIGLAFWFGLVWPLVKVYEFLVVGDLLKKAGEVGATRGGLFGYRGWSIRVRLAVFSGVLIAFWATAYVVLWRNPNDDYARDQFRLSVIFAIMAALLLGLLVYFMVRLVKGLSLRYHSWRRNLRLRKLTNTDP